MINPLDRLADPHDGFCPLAVGRVDGKLCGSAEHMPTDAAFPICVLAHPAIDWGLSVDTIPASLSALERTIREPDQRLLSKERLCEAVPESGHGRHDVLG